MAYEEKPGDFVLFPTREKRSDKAPDFHGHIILPDGTKKLLAAWQRSKGVVSGKIDEREPRPQGDAARQAPDRRDVPHVDHDDDLPW